MRNGIVSSLAQIVIAKARQTAEKDGVEEAEEEAEEDEEADENDENNSSMLNASKSIASVLTPKKPKKRASTSPVAEPTTDGNPSSNAREKWQTTTLPSLVSSCYIRFSPIFSDFPHIRFGMVLFDVWNMC
jgi:hypothetical protein